jgi:hypothetical protein
VQVDFVQMSSYIPLFCSDIFPENRRLATISCSLSSQHIRDLHDQSNSRMNENSVSSFRNHTNSVIAIQDREFRRTHPSSNNQSTNVSSSSSNASDPTRPSVLRRRQKRCMHPDGCQRQPSYGPAGGTAIYCAAHRLPAHRNWRARRCHVSGCQKQPIFGFPPPPPPRLPPSPETGRTNSTNAAASTAAASADAPTVTNAAAAVSAPAVPAVLAAPSSPRVGSSGAVPAPTACRMHRLPGQVSFPHPAM